MTVGRILIKNQLLPAEQVALSRWRRAFPFPPPVSRCSLLLTVHKCGYEVFFGSKPKNWCFWIVVLEKTLESPLDCKEIQPVHSKGDQSWVFFGRTDAKAETPILWPPDGKSWLIGKDPDAGRDCGQEEKGMTEDEMAGWHHWLDGHEFEWTLGVGDGQGGHGVAKSRTRLSDWTELTELND